LIPTSYVNAAPSAASPRTFAAITVNGLLALFVLGYAAIKVNDAVGRRRAGLSRANHPGRDPPAAAAAWIAKGGAAGAARTPEPAQPATSSPGTSATTTAAGYGSDRPRCHRRQRELLVGQQRERHPGLTCSAPEPTQNQYSPAMLAGLSVHYSPLVAGENCGSDSLIFRRRHRHHSFISHLDLDARLVSSRTEYLIDRSHDPAADSAATNTGR